MTSPGKTERIRVIDRDGNLVEEYDRPVEPDPEPDPLVQRLAALEEEVRGMRERAAAVAVTNSDAAKVRDAVAGPQQP